MGWDEAEHFRSSMWYMMTGQDCTEDDDDEKDEDDSEEIEK